MQIAIETLTAPNGRVASTADLKSSSVDEASIVAPDGHACMTGTRKRERKNASGKVAAHSQ
jgi:hypothetical protein